MERRAFNMRHGDRVFDAEIGNLLIEVKSDVRALRNLRSSLLEAAYELRTENPDKLAVLILANTTIADSTLREELEKARDTLHPKLANRLRLIRIREGSWRGFPEDPNPMLRRQIEELELLPAPTHRNLLRRDAYSELLKIMIYAWLTRSPFTTDWLIRTSGMSYPTVANVLDRVGHILKRNTDRSWELKYFPREEWSELVASSKRTRSTISFADHSGQKRSPQSLLRRLERISRKDLGIGGVAGAERYYPNLDLIGLPRIDLTIHAPKSWVDLSFVSAIDPALKQTEDRLEPVSLCLHFIRRQESLFDDSTGIRYADPVECLLDLHESRLGPQASEFLAVLIKKRDVS